MVNHWIKLSIWMSTSWWFVTQHTLDQEFPLILPSLLCFGDGVGASLTVVLRHIFTLFERSGFVLQNMTNAEGVSVQSALLAEFGAVGAQRLIIHLWEMDVFTFVHHVTLVPENISWSETENSLRYNTWMTQTHSQFTNASRILHEAHTCYVISTNSPCVLV